MLNIHRHFEMIINLLKLFLLYHQMAVYNKNYTT